MRYFLRQGYQTWPAGWIWLVELLHAAQWTTGGLREFGGVTNSEYHGPQNAGPESPHWIWPYVADGQARAALTQPCLLYSCLLDLWLLDFTKSTTATVITVIAAATTVTAAVAFTVLVTTIVSVTTSAAIAAATTTATVATASTATDATAVFPIDLACEEACCLDLPKMG